MVRGHHGRTDLAVPTDYLDAVVYLLAEQAWAVAGAALPELSVPPNPADRGADAVGWRIGLRYWAGELDALAHLLTLMDAVRPGIADTFVPGQVSHPLGRTRPSESDAAELAAWRALAYRAHAARAYEWIGASYGPAAEDAEKHWRKWLNRAHLAQEQLRGEALHPASLAATQARIERTLPHTLDSLGTLAPDWQAQLLQWGLRRRTDDEMREEYLAEITALLNPLGLTVAPPSGH